MASKHDVAEGARSRVTVVCFSEIAKDARVLRQVRRLSGRFEVSAVGYGRAGTELAPGAKLRSVPPPEGFFRRNVTAIPKLIVARGAARWGYDHWYWDRADRAAALTEIVQSKPHLIIANDWLALPVAVRAADEVGARVILDLHEYAPRQLDDSASWMFLIAPMVDHYLRRYASRVTKFITVNESIAVRFKTEYGFDAHVVTNAPEIDLQNAPVFRPTATDRIRMIHHGAPSPNRKLELSVRALAMMDERFSLTFMLTNQDPRYLEWLKRFSERTAKGRVDFRPAAPPQEIVPIISDYDLGLHIIPPTNYNYRVALPNKFFECVCAGLAVCIGPSPEMVLQATRYGFGVVAPAFEPNAIAQTLNRLTSEDIDDMKRRSIEARSHLNAATQMDKLERLCTEALAAS